MSIMLLAANVARSHQPPEEIRSVVIGLRSLSLIFFIFKLSAPTNTDSSDNMKLPLEPQKAFHSTCNFFHIHSLVALPWSQAEEQKVLNGLKEKYLLLCCSFFDIFFTDVFFFPVVASNFSPFILSLLSDTRSYNAGVISQVFYLLYALPSTHFTSFFIFFFPVCLPNVYHSMPFPLYSSSFNN